MQKARCYLAVPFAQKDEAKGLGARWDPARKLWYVPEGVDTAPFQRWFSADPALQNAPAVASSAKRPGSAPRKMESPGVVIPSTLPDFVPYSGDTPPWE